MKKYFFIFLNWQIQFLFALSVDITMLAPDFYANPGENYYGSTITINIDNDTGVPVNLDGQITKKLTSLENIAMPDESLRWKGHYISSGSFVKGYGNVDSVPYLVNTDDHIALVGTGAGREVALGTSIYVPSVQPRGKYSTIIKFTVYD